MLGEIEIGGMCLRLACNTNNSTSVLLKPVTAYHFRTLWALKHITFHFRAEYISTDR